MCTLVSCLFDDVSSGIGIGIAVADSMGNRVLTWYRSNPNTNTPCSALTLLAGQHTPDL